MHGGDGGGKVLFFPFKVSKARFRRQSFQEPDLTHRIKHVKSLTSESIRNAYFNLEQFSQSSRLPQPGISTVERLWNSFDSDGKLFMNQT